MNGGFERIFSFGVNSFKIVVSKDNKSLSFQVLSMDEQFRCIQKSDIKSDIEYYRYKAKNDIVIKSNYFPEVLGYDFVKFIYLQGGRIRLDNKVCVFKCDNAMKEYERIYYALLEWYENWFPKDEIVMEIPRWKRFVILPKEREI